MRWRLDKCHIYAKLGIVRAIKIFSQKAIFKTSLNGEEFRVSVIKEIFKIPEARAHEFPDGHKVSMIAFRDDDPGKRVLLDCHPPKGPHYHIGSAEVQFEWQGLKSADDLFWTLVEAEFGKLEEVLE